MQCGGPPDTAGLDVELKGQIPPNNTLLLTLATAVLVTLAGMLGLVYWQRRGL